MSTCKECFHYAVCAAKGKHANYQVKNGKQYIVAYENPVNCKHFKDRSKFIELKSAQRIKHKPKIEKMRDFHRLGIENSMSENSIFWTCSNCNGWVSLSYQYCPHCGAKMKEADQA